MRRVGSGKPRTGRAAARWLAHAVLGLILAVAGVASGTIVALEAGEPMTGRVVRVIDGDTIAVRIDKKVLTVRYIGISTREARMPADSMIAGPAEAAEFNRALVLGQTVRLELDAQEKDAQGRTLAYVYVGDLMVNAEMVANGYAAVSVKEPNVQFQEMLQGYERQARLLKVGRWRDSPYISREPTRRPSGSPSQSASASPRPTTTPRAYGTVDRPGTEPHDVWTCPISHPVKGALLHGTNERVFHLPGGEGYAKTQPDRCYQNAEEAREDGGRRAQR
ncbi:MAG TPA: thermonuclease family protein [Methylomirabilota bacterium]|nr:thermonuclease family protein [Methylomirabilota bacterium]